MNVWDVLLESREEVDPSAAGWEKVGDVRAERRVCPGAERWGAGPGGVMGCWAGAE